jgi:integrase
MRSDSRITRSRGCSSRAVRKKPATVKRYVATIARVHVAAGLLNPCPSETVRPGLKKTGRETSARQDQAHPLGWKEIKEFIDSAGESLRADRERAMLCVAYETLAQRGEFVAFEVRNIDFHPKRSFDPGECDSRPGRVRHRFDGDYAGGAAGSRRACRCSMRRTSMRRDRDWRGRRPQPAATNPSLRRE